MQGRWWMEADIPRIAEVLIGWFRLNLSTRWMKRRVEVADAIERGGEEALFRRYRGLGHYLCHVHPGILDLTRRSASSECRSTWAPTRSTEIVGVRDTIGLHGEAIVMQQIAGRWKSLGLIHVMNRLCPTSFFFEPLRTSHGTFLAVRTSSVPFDNVQNSTASFSDCYAAFDLRSGFPRLVAHEITSAWDRAAAIGAGGRYADTSLSDRDDPRGRSRRARASGVSDRSGRGASHRGTRRGQRHGAHAVHPGESRSGRRGTQATASTLFRRSRT